MPAVSCLQSEEEWSKYCTLRAPVLVHVTNKGRFVRQLKTQGTTEEDSSFRSFWSVRCGWMVLKALEKSKNINLIVFPEVSKTRFQTLMHIYNKNNQLFYHLYFDWHVWRMVQKVKECQMLYHNQQLHIRKRTHTKIIRRSPRAVVGIISRTDFNLCHCIHRQIKCFHPQAIPH